MLQFGDAIKLVSFASKNVFYKNSTYVRYLKQPSLLKSPNRSITEYRLFLVTLAILQFKVNF